MMKKLILLIALILLMAQSVSAYDSEELAKVKRQIHSKMSGMSCAKFKTGIPRLIEKADLIRHIEKGSMSEEIAIYMIKETLEKARSCIRF